MIFHCVPGCGFLLIYFGLHYMDMPSIQLATPFSQVMVCLGSGPWVLVHCL